MQESFVKIPKSLVDELSLIVNKMKKRQESVRQKIIEDSAHQNVSATYALELPAAQRWLEHLVVHSEWVAILLGDTDQGIVHEELA